MVKFTIISLFPEALKPYLDSSMLYKAQERGILQVEYVNLRDFGLGPHKSVDDTPYGGGDGMLLRVEPAVAAIEQIRAQDPDVEVIITTPVGVVWNQALARQFAGVASTPSNEKASDAVVASPSSRGSAAHLKNRRHSRLKGSVRQETQQRHYAILCPHYEGYDERILHFVDHQISIGNYILTGGELPALILIDSITRLLPGVLGGETSAAIESFSDDNSATLEFPQYTKPAEFRGLTVPEVLLSGHHGNVAKWREEQSKLRRRPGESL